VSAVVAGVADALDILVSAAQAISTITPIIQQAQAQGRTTLTAEEWAQITGNETSAEAALSAAIAKAKGLTAPAPSPQPPPPP